MSQETNKNKIYGNLIAYLANEGLHCPVADPSPHVSPSMGFYLEFQSTYGPNYVNTVSEIPRFILDILHKVEVLISEIHYVIR